MGSGIRRRAVAAIISVVALASLPGIPVGAASGPKAPPFAGGSYRQLPSPEVVNVRELPAAVAGARPSVVRPELVKNHAARAAQLSAAAGAPKIAAPRAPQPATILTGTTQGTVLEQLSAFPGMDITTGVTLFGQSNNMEPPDTQIAAGPSVLVEMVNANMSVWSKAGARLAGIDLNVFYGVPAGYQLTDPRVIYDQNSGRFIATAVAIADTIANNSWNSNVYLAVSQTSDPTGTWLKVAMKTTSAILIDQPKVGTSDDKITLAWSEWIKPGCDVNFPTFPCFIGEVIGVVDKIDMMGSVPGPEYLSGRDINRYAIVPVQALSSTTTQYLAYNDADPYNLVENGCGTPPLTAQYWNCPAIAVMSLTGSVHAQTLVMNEVLRPINSTLTPPKAVQFNNAGLLDTGDDRLLNAVWQNNQLWTSNGDGNYCPMINPTGPGQRSCALIIEVKTDTNPMQVLQDVEINSGDFVYHPGISLDNAGDLFVVLSRSSSAMYPSAWITGLPAATPNTWSPLAQLAAGAGPYDSKTQCGGNNRWGDYSGASVDGTDATDVWVAGEYAGLDAARNCIWKTAIGRLTYSAPTVTSIKPAIGPGGTSVTITGTDFLAGNTTPYFGLTPSGSGTTTVLTPNSLTTTAPPGNGWVTISASTPDGHGPAGPTFKYPRIEAAPGSLVSRAGAAARRGAPPHVAQTTAGPRPAVQVPPQNLPTPLAGSNSPSPSGGGQGEGQPVRLLRLLLL